MIRVLQQGVRIAVFSMLLFSCKKDAVPPKPPGINELIETEPALFTPIAVKINDVTFGLYSSVPVHYSETTKKYPLIIFYPGAGQLGRTPAELYLLAIDGLMEIIAKKKFPPNFEVNGKNFSFIVLTPQYSQTPTTAEAMDFVQYAKANYRVDQSRIYLSGLSMGGIIASDLGAASPQQFAAIVPMAGVYFEGVVDKSAKIAKGNLPVWAFHNKEDPQITLQIPLFFISEINKNAPAIPPKLTIFNAYGHDSWHAALNPEYHENGMNIYEWMLHYTR